ncbi:TPR and ankyrin repeat-containing protein 1 isoform X3 [Eretmochelys imbricata]
MDLMNYAEFMKKAGNENFKNGNYFMAIRNYDEAIRVLFQLFQWGMVSHRDVAVLLCNKSNAFYSLGKWEEAYHCAKESLQWDLSYVKGYYRSGYSLLRLSRTHDAVIMFSRGLTLLCGSVDQSQIADFIVGIFTSVNDEKYIAPYFLPIFKNILNERFDPLVWQVVIEKLAKKGMWQSLMLVATERDTLPRNLRVTHLSLKDLFEKYVLFGHYERMERVPELVEWLITIGANVGSIGTYPLHAIINLCIKAKGNHLFRWLLDEIPDLKGSINQQDQDGCTVLHVVASHSSGYPMKRQTENVQMLLNTGVDPTIPDAQARCAADILKKNKNFKAVDIINNHLARHAPSSKESPGKSKSKASVDETNSFLDAFEQFLMFCSPENQAQHKNLLTHETVQRFLKLLSTVKEIPEEMVCDIYDTCASSFIKLLLEKQMWHEVLLLLTRKANGEMPSCGGLIRNCRLSDLNIGSVIKQVDRRDKRRVHLVRCLLERGASPEGTGDIPEKPLQICLKNNDFELAYLLLSHGADTRSVSIVEGDTPLHAAVSICLDKSDDIGLRFLNYLLDLYGSNPSVFPHLNPNSQDKNGNTVMHIIFQKAQTKQVKKIMDLLAKFDINFNLKNKLGKDVRHRIKKNDPRLLTWNTAVSEKRKYRQDTVGQLVKLPKSIPVCNTSQPKSTAHSSSASVWRASPGNSAPANTDPVPDTWEEADDAQLTKQETGEVNKTLTLRESLVKAITDLIQHLQLGDNPIEDNSQVPNPSSALTSVEGKKSELQQTCGYESLAHSKGEGADSEKVEDTEKECDESDMPMPNGIGEETVEVNGQIQDIEAYIQDFDNMTWEIECTSEMLKKLGSKAVPHYMKKKIILAIQQLGNGEWTQGLQKRLKHLKADIQLYEAKLDKGARMLWELAIDFSPRCSEAAEKIIETEQSIHPLEKSGRVYTEIIRIWDIVLDHCKLDRAISTICTAYNRGLSCILRKKLKGISKIKQSSNLKTQKRIPRCYVEDTEAEKTKEHIIPEYFPPASAVETEYNVMKFHSFSTNMALNIINDMNSAVEYPFRVGELEYAVIDLSPKPMEPIILIGRSGTGKTTCCLYRLWKKFHSYWEKAQLAGAPLLVRQMWQRRKFEIESEKSAGEEEDNEKQRNNDSSESIELESIDDEPDDEGEQYSSADDTELNLLGDCEEEEEHSTEESDNLEHLHQIFVTKNHVLCQEVQRNFIELSKSSKSTSHFQPLESNVYKLQDVKDENFPLYVTSKQLLLLLDASMPDPFFLRNEDGSLKRTIVGWSTQEDLVIPNWQEEEEESNAEVEYGILHLASGVVDLLQHYFPESFDRLPRDTGLFDGPKPTVLESCSVSDLAILLRGNKRKTQPIEFGAHQVILVANEMVKDKIPEELSLALVLTIYEAKGLEFDDVLLYNFFTDSEAYKEWKIISSFTPSSDSLGESKLVIETPLEKNIATQSRSLVLNPEMYKMLNGELKQLYTAITRARVNLWIFDENSDKRAPAFKYFIKREFVQVVKIDENKDLDDSMFVKTSTPEEWIAQGEYYAKHQCWKVAAKCYQKGGAIEKEKLALAHDAVLNVQSKKSSPKEKQMDYMYLAKTYLECGEPKLSLKCLIYAKEFQLCAELYEKLGKIKDAAYFYKRSQCYRDASRCYEQIQEFDLALKMCCHEELYEEAAILVERYEEILRVKRQPVSKLSYSANQFYLEASAKYLRENKTKEMMAVLSRLDTEDQLVFLKSRKCLAQAADLLRREGRQEEAAMLMKQHGFVLEAAKLTTKKEFRASCLLAAVRFSITGCSELENRDTILEEALELCKQTNQKSSIAEATFLQGVLKKDFRKLEEAFYKFLPLNHCAGVVEALFESTHCEPKSQGIFFLAPCGLEALLNLFRALQKAATNAEKEMVKSCFDYFGILPIDGNVCQVSQNEAGHILQFLPDNPILKEKKTKDHFIVGMEEVKSALNKHFLSRLCSIACSILEQSYPDICMKFIAGLKCEDKTCKDFHRPLLRHEAKSILQCKMHLAAINGLLLQAKRVFPKELLHEFNDIDEILTADKYILCKSLLDFVFPKHFHLRVVSENPKACKDILGLHQFSKPCRMVLKEYIIFQFKSENAINRRESTDLWLRAMQVFILSSSYPEEFEKLLAKEEDDYNKELKLLEAKKYKKEERGRGGRPKGVDGRYGMLIPDKYSGNAENTHLCFIRLLENSLEQLYVYRNPEDCKWMFFRFMNVLVKKCIEPLIPSIGNTVMLLEFQYILCCAVLMRLCKNITLCLPKSYIALFHYWEFLFRKKDQKKEIRDMFSIIQEYKPKDTNEAVKEFKFHLLYVAKVLCGAKNSNFNVLLDAFRDPDCITSGEAERTMVLCLVMLVNADQVLSPRCKSLLHEHFPEIKSKLINMKKDCPSKVPERLVKIVERVNDAVDVRKIAEGLQELLIERDEEYLADCHWKWDTMYAKGASIRGIFYEQVNLDRIESHLDPLEYFEEPETELERDLYVEEREDPLTAIASIKQQKQQQKAHAKRKLWRLFLLAYYCIKWRRNSCSKTDPIGMEKKELVSGIFKKADIDRTQCDLCGVKFIQGPENYFIQKEDLERETSEAVTPTETDPGEKESIERSETVVASETYVKHRHLDEHRNKYTAYQNYFEFFKRNVDPKLREGLDIVDTIEQNTWITSHLIFKEHSNVVQRKIQENIKKISDIVEDIYKRKAWADAEEIMTKPVSSLSVNLGDARKWLKNTESHMVKEEGFADDKDFENEGQDEMAAFEELFPKKSSRKKGKRRK